MSVTKDRVSTHTSDAINRQLAREIEDRVSSFAKRPDQIEARLHELDQEWDIERTLEANASTLAFSGVALAATVNKRWLALPAVVLAFLFQHAVQGWCPPLPILRRLGFRTSSEIERERYALKALRGDFAHVEQADNKAEAAIRAVRS